MKMEISMVMGSTPWTRYLNGRREGTMERSEEMKDEDEEWYVIVEIQ
jgi:hypothetical protein